MQIVLIIIVVLLLLRFLPDLIGWLRYDLPKHSEAKKRRREQQAREAERERRYNAEHSTPNVLVLQQDAPYKQARFQNGTVYVMIGSREFKIGSYGTDGKVYSADGYEIGRVGVSKDADALISLNRLGDLQRHLETYYNKSDERQLTENEMKEYSPLCKNTNVAWTCARVWRHGVVDDFDTSEEIAQPKHCVTGNEQSTLGYGACFICLQYMTMQNTRYSRFYCPLGTYFHKS